MSFKPTPALKLPWIVRKHHLLRSFSFALLMSAITLHLWGSSTPALVWSLLALQFLVYPHLVYWRAARAEHPSQAEMQNLLVDTYLLGLWAAVLGLPLWLSFAMATGGLFNNAFNKGWRGSVTASLTFLAGVFTWVGLGRFSWQPEMGLGTTLFCIGGLLVYVLALGDIAYLRNRQLRQARHDLEHSEAALRQANTSLQRQLAEIGNLQEQLREQALRDPLTLQYNRRYLDTTLPREFNRCQREQAALSVLMIDIDHFKHVNDTHGHPAGDEVLRRLGRLLADSARSHDVVCRYGGEEFLVLLPQMPRAAAVERAEQIRQRFAHLSFTDVSPALYCTVSIGVATYPDHGHSPDTLVRSADRALYAAKDAGRNRVVADQAQAAAAATCD
jgi:diguanylate cyclase (GGDEF)-like protein